MGKLSEDCFRFADFLLDLSKGRLFKGTEDVTLRPKSFALLSYLVRHAGRVVHKDELIETLWPDVTVTEDSLTQCVSDVRRALGDNGASLLRTVPRRGYLFAVPVAQSGQVTRVTPAGQAVAASSPPTSPGPMLRPDGIAVLPFVLMSVADPGDGRLIDGLVHDVISRLARLRSFHVIASSSTFAMRHLASNPQEAGRALNVAYAVAGTAEMDDKQVRLRLELVQATNGALVWAEVFVHDRTDFLNLIGSLTNQIVQTVQMEVTAAEARRALTIPAQNLDAWQAYQMGLHEAMRLASHRLPQALAQLQQSARPDPGFARAYAGQSFSHDLGGRHQ